MFCKKKSPKNLISFRTICVDNADFVGRLSRNLSEVVIIAYLGHHALHVVYAISALTLWNWSCGISLSEYALRYFRAYEIYFRYHACDRHSYSIQNIHERTNMYNIQYCVHIGACNSRTTKNASG